MRKLLILPILFFLLAVPGTASNNSCALSKLIRGNCKSNDFATDGFAMCGTALAASRTVDENDPKILALEKELLKNQRSAIVLKDVKSKMIVNTAYKTSFGINISKRRLVDVINDWLKVYGNFSTSIIYRYSEVMEAKLTGDGFEILPQSETIQKFPDDKEITWDFLVTPKRPGTLKLHLEIYAIETKKSGHKVRTHKHEEDIEVYSTLHSDVKHNLGPESTVGMALPVLQVVGWVLFTLVTVVGSWLGIKKHKRKK